MQRTLATRLEKLERRNKPADAVFFLVWGADRAGVDKAVADARAAGKIGDDDTVIAEVWSTELEPRPATRWLLNRSGRKGLSDDEERILLEIMFAESHNQESAWVLPSSPTPVIWSPEQLAILQRRGPIVTRQAFAAANRGRASASGDASCANAQVR
jgi:hypothetical protein